MTFRVATRRLSVRRVDVLERGRGSHTVGRPESLTDTVDGAGQQHKEGPTMLFGMPSPYTTVLSEIGLLTRDQGHVSIEPQCPKCQI